MTTEPIGGQTWASTPVLSVGLDSSQTKRGAEEIVRAYEQIKAGARTVKTETDRSFQQMAEQMRAAAQSTLALERAMGTLKTIAAAVGLSFLGMRFGSLIQEATNLGARFETLGVVLARVGQNTRYSATEIFGFAQSVQKAGITMQESRQTIISLVQAEIDLANATKLARVAQDAAVIGNTNSSDALNRLIYGIKSAQVEVLRTVGLQVNFEAAYERYAASINKAVGSMTEQERAQARVNEVMRAGTMIAGSYEASMNTAGKQLSSMTRYVEDALTKVGAAFQPVFTDLIGRAVEGMNALNKALDKPATVDALQRIGEGLKSFSGVGLVLAGAVTSAVALRAAMLAAAAAGSGLVALFAGPWGAAIGLAAAALGGLLTHMVTHKSLADQVREREDRLEKQYRATQMAVGELSNAEQRLARQRAETAVGTGRADFMGALSERARATDALYMAIERAQDSRRSLDAEGAPSRFASSATRERYEERVRIANEIRDLGQAYATGQQGIDDVSGALVGLDQRARAVNDTILLGFVKAMKEAVEVLRSAESNVQRTEEAFLSLRGAAEQAGRPIVDVAAKIKAFQDAMGSGPGNSLLSGTGALQNPQEVRQQSRVQALDDMVRAANDAVTQQQQALDRTTPGTAAYTQAVENLATAQRTLNNLTAAYPTLLRGIMSEQQAAAKALADMEFEARIAGMNPDAARRERERRQVGQQADEMVRSGSLTAETRQPWVDQALRAREQAAQAQAGRSVADDRVRAEYAEKITRAEVEGEAAVRRVRAEMDLVIAAQQGSAALASAVLKAREAEVVALAKVRNEIDLQNRATEDKLALADARLRGPGASLAEEQNQRRAEIARQVGDADPAALARAQEAAAEALRRARYADAASQATERLASSREELVIAERELELRWETNEVRQSEIEKLRVRVQLERDLALAKDPQEAARLRAVADEQEKIAERIGRIRGAQQDAQEWRQAMSQAGNAISTAFEDAVMNGKKFSDVLKGIEQDIARIILRMAVTKPLEQAIGGLLGPVGSEIGGWIGGLFGNSNATTTAPIIPVTIEQLHGGGVAGHARHHRSVPMEVFAGAPRFHSGGWPGLQPNEVPTILEKGERVLTVAQQKSMGGGASINISVDAKGAEEGVEQRIDAVLARRMPVLLDTVLARTMAESDRGGVYARSMGRRR